jgi:hypothetical protein
LSGDTIFYRCSRALDPTDREIEVSEKACPSMRQFPTQCGEGYTGVKCLECLNGYGTDGPECRSNRNSKKPSFSLSLIFFFSLL